MSDAPDYLIKNREAWEGWAPGYAEWAPRAWKDGPFTWGMFSVPDAELGAMPGDVAGLDAIELGCGTAYISAWLARHGARPVGVDASPAQLETARRMQAEHGLEFPLHLGNAEATPFADMSFDLVISEYGASIWCDPYLWIPEAARLLRPGGRLIFLANGLLVALCSPLDAGTETPVTERLERPLFGLHRIDWSDGTTNFYLSHGEWFRLLRANGFAVENLIEIQAPDGAATREAFLPVEWARQWPGEEIWVARKG